MVHSSNRWFRKWDTESLVNLLLAKFARNTSEQLALWSEGQNYSDKAVPRGCSMTCSESDISGTCLELTVTQYIRISFHIHLCDNLTFVGTGICCLLTWLKELALEIVFIFLDSKLESRLFWQMASSLSNMHFTCSINIDDFNTFVFCHMLLKGTLPKLDLVCDLDRINLHFVVL